MNKNSEIQQEIAVALAEFTPEVANSWDQSECIPDEVLESLASAQLLGCHMGREFGGKDWNSVELGILFEELGQVSLSLVSILTVHCMVQEVVRQWGSSAQKQHWLPDMVKGRTIAAFALTEPKHGSDATGIQTVLRSCENGYRLQGVKKWISYSQKAGVFLVFAIDEQGKHTACLVPSDAPGISVKPVGKLLGFRGASLGQIEFNDCFVAQENIIGQPGTGISYVAGNGLDLGRLAISFGCLGAMKACISDSVVYAREREQFGQQLIQHQLIQQMLADMITAHKAASHLCYSAAKLRSEGDPMSTMETTVAKYFASTQSVKVADMALQIHGAVGCSAEESRIERYYRDVRITEIIEGSNQMQQMMIAQNGMGEWVNLARKRSALGAKR
jgi:hypothetical protein|tara:strand:- start:1627 stop:2793 length:1167 start_codon:yes stop_codon:yes gene_type:complete